VSEADLAGGVPERVKALIVPCGAHIAASAYAALAKFSQQHPGALLITGNSTAMRNELDRQMMGHSGLRMALVLPYVYAQTPRGLFMKSLVTALNRTHVEPAIQVHSDGDPAESCVSWRSASDGKSVVLNIVNYGQKPQTVMVTQDREPVTCQDVLDGRKLLPGARLILKPLEVRLLRVTR
jgi:hypothetical protein